MKISVISFTKRGMELSYKVRDILKSYKEEDVEIFTKHKTAVTEAMMGTDKITEENKETLINIEIKYVSESLHQWTEKQFTDRHALLFIGACAIAVRTIAPFIKDKLSDSPVLVMDEAGRFVIPVLSGHYGGANELAERIAKDMGATPVITTATDVNGLFAVDVFAKKNNFTICDKEGIKKVSSAVLAKLEVTMAVAGEYSGQVPEEITLVDYPTKKKVSVMVSPYFEDGEKAELQLCPRAYVIGTGCKRGKSPEEIEKVISKQLKLAGIRMEAVFALASIDRKKDEEGLLQYAKGHNLPFLTFSEKILSDIEGDFRASAFVKEQVGVDNVCERSAMAASGKDGELIIKKYAENGITVAIAKKKWSAVFDEKHNLCSRDGAGSGRNDDLSGD